MLVVSLRVEIGDCGSGRKDNIFACPIKLSLRDVRKEIKAFRLEKETRFNLDFFAYF